MTRILSPENFGLVLSNDNRGIALVEDPKLSAKFSVYYPDKKIHFTPMSQAISKIIGLKLFSTVLLSLGLVFLSANFRASFELYLKNLRVVVLDNPLAHIKTPPLTGSLGSLDELELSPISCAEGERRAIGTPTACTDTTDHSPMPALDTSPLQDKYRTAAGHFARGRTPSAHEFYAHATGAHRGHASSPVNGAVADIEEYPQVFTARYTRPGTPRPADPDFLLGNTAQHLLLQDAEMSPEGFPDLTGGSPSIRLNHQSAQATAPSQHGTVALPKGAISSFFLSKYLGLKEASESIDFDDKQLNKSALSAFKTAFFVKNKMQTFDAISLQELSRFWKTGSIHSFLFDTIDVGSINLTSEDLQNLFDASKDTLSRHDFLKIALSFVIAPIGQHDSIMHKLIESAETVLYGINTLIQLPTDSYSDFEALIRRYNVVELLKSSPRHSQSKAYERALVNFGSLIFDFVHKIRYAPEFLIKDLIADMFELYSNFDGQEAHKLDLNFMVLFRLQEFNTKWKIS